MIPSALPYYYGIPSKNHNPDQDAGGRNGVKNYKRRIFFVNQSENQIVLRFRPLPFDIGVCLCFGAFL
jgi:hypothetical protein